MRPLFPLAMLLCTFSLQAQWQIQDSHSTASFRGVDYVGHGVAWVSGTGGAVLRTVDMGKTWTKCAVPPEAEKLDFRAIQAFDEDTAIVMSSGPGDLSRLYKTMDACKSWTLLFTNPDKDGFWDALVARSGHAVLIGDPVQGRFVIFGSTDGAFESWDRLGEQSDVHHIRIDYGASPGEGLFAASNSVLAGSPESGVEFVTGGPQGAFFGVAIWSTRAGSLFAKLRIPLASGAGAGAFSLASRSGQIKTCRLVVVGGDYTKPHVGSGTSAYSRDGGMHWKASSILPHGYRSAVAYDEKLKAWITVGPNGTDVSFDDGKHWKPLHPSAEDAAGADKNWNALSLPFVVGPQGRIGILRESAATR